MNNRSLSVEEANGHHVVCYMCEDSNFKSAVSEARDGRASLRPDDWVKCLGCESRDIVDILICQTQECGYYTVVNYNCHGSSRRIAFIGSTVSVKMIQRQHERKAALISRQGGICHGVARLITRFSDGHPGDFAPSDDSKLITVAFGTTGSYSRSDTQKSSAGCFVRDDGIVFAMSVRSKPGQQAGRIIDFMDDMGEEEALTYQLKYSTCCLNVVSL